jgi:vacuolar protein sorting-associated protein 52
MPSPEEEEDAARALLLGESAARQNDAKHASEKDQKDSKDDQKPHKSAFQASSASEGLDEAEEAARAELLQGENGRGKRRSEQGSVALEDLDFDSLDVTSGVASSSSGGDKNNNNTGELGELESFLRDMGGLDALAAHLEGDPELRAVCEQESDLAAYAEKQAIALEEAEREAIDAYLAEEDTVARLYDEMGRCDETLGQLEDLLLRFQVDIGGIGAEIRDLQNECLSHQIKLDNRKRLESELGQFIDGINVAGSLSHALLHDAVDDVYLEYLVRFNQQISFLVTNKTLPDGSKIAAYRDVAPKVRELRQAAQTKLRGFILGAIGDAVQSAAKKEQGSSVLGPRGAVTALHKRLVDFAYFFQFLFKHAPPVADEVRNSYTDSMSRLYAQHFRALFSQAARRQFVLAGKNDLIGVEESKLRGFFSGRKTIKNKASVFALGRRAAVVASLVSNEAPPQTAEDLLLEGDTGALSALTSLVGVRSSSSSAGDGDAGDDRQSFELLFRSILWDLVQAVKDELTFVQDFFLGTFDDELAAQLFAGPLGQMQDDWLEKYVSGTYDAIGVLLCLVHVQHSRKLMREKLVSALDPFFATAHGALAARFFHLCDLNTQSISQATDRASSISARDVRPHYMTRRFAEFVSSVTHLCRRSAEFDERKFVDRVMRTLMSVREEMQRLLTALAVTISDKRQQTVFLINNLDLVVSVLKEHEPARAAGDATATGDADEPSTPRRRDRLSSELEHFEQLLDGKIRALARVELDNRFADLLDFAQRHADMVASDAGAVSTTATEKDVEALLRHFHDTWRPALQELQGTVMTDFSNFVCGSRLMRLILDELTESYSVVAKIVRSHFKSLRTSKYFVPEATVEAERQKTLY